MASFPGESWSVCNVKSALKEPLGASFAVGGPLDVPWSLVAAQQRIHLIGEIVKSPY
jgi:hypothetical protein